MEKADHEVAVVEKPINTIVGKTWVTFNATFRKSIDEVSRTKPDLIGITAICYIYYGLESLGVFKGRPISIHLHSCRRLSNCTSVEFVLR